MVIEVRMVDARGGEGEMTDWEGSEGEFWILTMFCYLIWMVDGGEGIRAYIFNN